MKQGFHPDPELDALVRELNRSARDKAQSGQGQKTAAVRPAGWPLPEPAIDAGELLERYLAKARRINASDLLIVGGCPPTARVDGELVPVAKPLSVDVANTLCGEITPGRRRAQAGKQGTSDFSLSLPGLGRFRCNVHRQQGNWAAAIRLLPAVAPDLDQLHLPPVLEMLAEMEHGLILVTGPTGSGKTTTLASLMRLILANRRIHAITIEDPVEYEHPSGGSIVEHIEIGTDAVSFPDALRAALRQDPDLLLVGEMRDPESIGIAITAAETGHLVLSTLHTGDVVQSVNRILDSYPPGQIDTVRTQLSISLAAIVSQTLVPRSGEKGRVPAVEIMFATDAIRNLIRKGNVEQIRGQMELDRKAGCIPMDHSLAILVKEGLIGLKDARLRARNPQALEAMLPR